MRSLALVLGMFLAAVGLLGAGCGDGAPSAASGASARSTPPSTMPEPTTTGSSFVTVFFADDLGTLVPERRPALASLESALTELAAGPRDPALIPALPQGTEVRAASVSGGVATADFSADLAAGYPSGGAAAELATLAPIVFTATELPGVSAVRITVDGAPPDLPGSQLDLSRPLTRADVGAQLAGGP